MELSQVGFNHRGQNFRCAGDITDPDWTMLFRRTMVQEVLRTFQQGENRYTCCRRTVLSGEKGTKIGYRQGSNLGPLATGGFCPLDLPLDHAASWGLAQVGFSHRPQKFRWKGDITDPLGTMLFRRIMVREVFRTSPQGVNRYTCC